MSVWTFGVCCYFAGAVILGPPGGTYPWWVHALSGVVIGLVGAGLERPK